MFIFCLFLLVMSPDLRNNRMQTLYCCLKRIADTYMRFGMYNINKILVVNRSITGPGD